MKKILTSLLALFASCSLLSACSIVDDVKGWFDKGNASESQSEETSSTLDSVPEDTTSEDSTSEEPSTDPHVEAMELAKDFVYGSLIEKDLEVSKDYTLIKTFYSGILDEELTITWTVDVTEGVTLVEGETEWTVDVDEFAKEDIFYTLTATLADSDGHTATFTLDRKVLKAADVIPEKITEAPVEGEAYKLYMYQVTKKVDLYFTGAMSGFYLATNNTSKGEGYEKAVDVFVENVEGKDGYFYIYFNEKTEDSEGNETFVKQYFGISNTHNDKGWHVNAIYSPTNVVADGAVGTYEFTWSDKLGTFIATVEGVTYEDEDDNVVTNTSNFYFGTYSSYYTIGTSHVDNFDNDDACIVYFVKMVNKSEVSAEDKVAGEKETLNVTTAFSGAVEYTLPTQGTTYGDVAISWALKSDNATLTDNVLTLASPEAELKVVLTATFTCGEATTTKDVEITVYPKSLVELVSEPQENTAYVLYLYQANKAKNYYLTGAMDGNFLGTTDDATKAADVYAEKADNGIKIYVMDASGAKSYIKLTEYESSGKYKASVSFATEGSIFTYDSQFSMWKCNTGNEVFYLGTYNDYTTMSTSAASFVKVDNVGKTQFCANFGILDESALPPEGGEEGGDTPIVPEVTTSTIASILAAENGEYQAEGTVMAVTAKSFVLKDSTGMMLVYLNAAPSVKAGDKVTVKGTTSVYGAGKQFGAGSEVTFVSEGSVGMQIATSLTAADVDAYAAVTNVTIKYVEVTATLSINATKGYYNLTVDGATAMASISYPTDEMKAVLAELDGKEISVEGYFIGVTGSSTKYVQIMATSVRATDEGIGDDKPGVGEECKHEYDKEGVCVHCGEKDPDFKPEVDEECEHEYDKEGVCVHCGEACEHSFVDGVCENCGVAEPEEGEHECVYEAEVTAPTCTTAGYTTHTCSICQDSYTDSEVAAVGHKDAGEDYKCDVCSAVMAPEADSFLTIPQAIALGKALGPKVYTTNKYYMTVVIESIYDTQYGNANVKDADGNKYVIYGLYSYDGKVRYDALEYKPVAGDEIVVYGIIGSHSYDGVAFDSMQMKSGWLDDVVAHDHAYESLVTAPTCTTDGYTTHTCSICNATFVDGETPALGHTTEEGVCGNCGKTIGSEAPVLTEKTYSYTLAKGDAEVGTVNLGGVDWTIAGASSYFGWDSNTSAKGVQFGSGSNPFKTLTVTSEEFSNVSKITLNTSGAKSIAGTCKVYVGDTLLKTITLTATATNYEIEVNGLTGAVKFEYSQTSSKALYIKSIAVNYAE